MSLERVGVHRTVSACDGGSKFRRHEMHDATAEAADRLLALTPGPGEVDQADARRGVDAVGRLEVGVDPSRGVQVGD